MGTKLDALKSRYFALNEELFLQYKRSPSEKIFRRALYITFISVREVEMKRLFSF
jgi:hypothetical protein